MIKSSWFYVKFKYAEKFNQKAFESLNRADNVAAFLSPGNFVCVT